MISKLQKSTGWQLFHTSPQSWLHTLYSKDDQQRILKFINETDSSLISRFKLPTSFHKVLDFRKKNGPIKELNDLLEIKGISSKPAVSLCDTILVKLASCSIEEINVNQKDANTDQLAKKVSQRRLQKILSPSLVQKFAAVNIMTNSISWAVLEEKEMWRSQTLVNWNFYDIPKIPFQKINLIKEIVSLRNILPREDVYVLINSNSGKGGANPLQDQLYGIILSILCSYHNFTTDVVNNIHFMNYGAPGNVMNLNVGNETISAQNTLTDLLSNKRSNINAFNTKLLEKLTEINFEDKCVQLYLSQDGFHRESLTKALILAKAFIEVILDSSGVQ